MKRRTTLYVIIFILGFVAISLFNFYSVTHPPHITVHFTPDYFDMLSEDIEIVAPDGVLLSGWLVASPEEKKRAVILLHGYPVEKSDMLFIADSLYPDFSLLLLDLRSFGESGGSYTTFGIKERGDIRAALDFLEVRGYESVGIFGFSLGGAIGFLTAAEDERVRAVASYASFSDLKTLGNDVYWRLWILKKPMVELMLFWSELFFGESMKDVSPVKAAEKLTIPVFIVHSKNDNQIPFSHAERLKDALKENEKAEYLFFESRIHGDLPKDFYTKLNDFFTRAL